MGTINSIIFGGAHDGASRSGAAKAGVALDNPKLSQPASRTKSPVVKFRPSTFIARQGASRVLPIRNRRAGRAA
jgi:hypothetical protein